VSLRVVHVCAYFAPAFVYGGPPRSIFGLCRAQRDAGIDVRVVTTTANGDSELSEAVVARGEYEGIPVRYCARAWPRSIFHSPSLGAVVATELREADVLHIHGLWNATVWSAAAAAREQRKPYVLSPRGMLAPAALAHDKWRKKLVYPLADRRVIRDAARRATSGNSRISIAFHSRDAPSTCRMASSSLRAVIAIRARRATASTCRRRPRSCSSSAAFIPSNGSTSSRPRSDASGRSIAMRTW
jgi:glycosyltransferase involved in cell wall biosynthesis